METITQTSAGGVVYRSTGDHFEVALISVGENNRWQLPKGALGKNEGIEAAARREVREETGIESELIAPIERIEYWFYGNRQGRPIRYHKFVDFYLMRFVGGNVTDHDHEVNEARWVEIGLALEMLAFESERRVVSKANEMIQTITDPGSGNYSGNGSGTGSKETGSDQTAGEGGDSGGAAGG